MIIYIAMRKDSRTGDEFPHLPSAAYTAPELARDAAAMFDDDNRSWADRFPVARIARFEVKEVGE